MRNNKLSAFRYALFRCVYTIVFVWSVYTLEIDLVSVFTVLRCWVETFSFRFFFLGSKLFLSIWSDFSECLLRFVHFTCFSYFFPSFFVSFFLFLSPSFSWGNQSALSFQVFYIQYRTSVLLDTYWDI